MNPSRFLQLQNPVENILRTRGRLRWTMFLLGLSGAAVSLCCGSTDAMVYRPSQGRFKDGFVCRHNGQFLLFSMCSLSGADDFRHVWLATSADGVHWKDVGPVIHDAPFNIWAMSVHQVGDKFILNHGSFSRPGVQNVIRFWESSDLVHWSYLGPQSDLFPDPRWYHPDSRLDCMSVVPVAKGSQTHYYGYATGPGGFLESADGRHWTGLPQPQVEWDTVQPPPTPADEGGFEVGGCHATNGKYYLVGGWFNYHGHSAAQLWKNRDWPTHAGEGGRVSMRGRNRTGLRSASRHHSARQSHIPTTCPQEHV